MTSKKTPGKKAGPLTRTKPFDPLSYDNLGASVERELLATSACHPLPPAEPFWGAGIYAIFYHGDFEPYAPTRAENCDGRPIYVGQATAPGARKGRIGSDVDPGPALYSRLRQHAGSISAATNLRLGDFSCRYLVTVDVWIALGEAVAINKLKPLWNVGPVDGFGNHPQGAGRDRQERSAWDVLHPGRAAAASLKSGRTPEQIEALVRDWFAGRIPSQPPTHDDEEPPVADLPTT